MSKTSLALLAIAAALVTAATYFELPFAAGGSGVLLLVALGYAYVVTKRDMTLLSYAMKDNEYEGYSDVGFGQREPAE
jgi:preprotein translocase subunit SecY